MIKEREEQGEESLNQFEQRVFASSFAAFDAKNAMDRFGKLFNKNEEEKAMDYEVSEFEPEDELDVQKMLNEARRSGVIR